jgi:hypothetical protein
MTMVANPKTNARRRRIYKPRFVSDMKISKQILVRHTSCSKSSCNNGRNAAVAQLQISSTHTNAQSGSRATCQDTCNISSLYSAHNDETNNRDKNSISALLLPAKVCSMQTRLQETNSLWKNEKESPTQAFSIARVSRADHTLGVISSERSSVESVLFSIIR